MFSSNNHLVYYMKYNKLLWGFYLKIFQPTPNYPQSLLQYISEQKKGARVLV